MMKKNQNNDEYKCEFQPILLIYSNFDPTDDLIVLFEHWLENISIEHKEDIEILIIILIIQSFSPPHIRFQTEADFIFQIIYLWARSMPSFSVICQPVNKSCAGKTKCRNDHKKKIFSNLRQIQKATEHNYYYLKCEEEFLTSDYRISRSGVGSLRMFFIYIVSVHNLIFL